ncbi:MAG TPA: DUF2283 domain-containing protein [Anaerohalosphaeraceae bacterium]|nr:DUF2283 domain-containing protein [Anaerohalosphaeraceae bacterium]HOL88829.1 DUF2283 domain-containing protein [Anaerohalosphaeraceae bacterium]HPP55661.1 DUF2283 domain-containing protein [Anaerohalosphaeraceae bacterium]
MEEKMNITHHYDEEADILYIDFGSNEPCFTEDIDGVVMLEIGWFSKLPRGIKVIGPKAHHMKSFNFQLIIRKCRDLLRNQAKQIENQESYLQEFLKNKFKELALS